MNKNDRVTFGKQEYILCEKLGSGGNGEVWSAKIKGSGLLFHSDFLLNVAPF